MIIGRGMLANYFAAIDRVDVNFFCSGVSDCINLDFSREKKLIDSLNRKIFLVYTSSLSAISQKTPYQLHKFNMESFIINEFDNYIILRVGNLVGNRQNDNQFFPNLLSQVFSGIVRIVNCKRDLLLTSDYVSLVKFLIEDDVKNKILNICSFSPPFVSQIVDEIEKNCCKSKRLFVDGENYIFPKPDVITGDKWYYKYVIKEILHKFPQ